MKQRLILALVFFLTLVVPAAGQTIEDPRTENARAFHTNAAGLVDGVQLIYEERPYTTYQLVQARLVDEGAAAGNTVAKFVVVDCYGTPISENVWLAWAYPAMLDGKALPGNQNNEHMVSGLPYSPPDIGPGALYVGDSQGRINSDVIGGLGLPFKRHVSYYLAWRKRCGIQVLTPTPTSNVTPNPTVTSTPIVTATPGPSPTPGPVVGDLTETNNLLRQILLLLQGLARRQAVRRVTGLWRQVWLVWGPYDG